MPVDYEQLRNQVKKAGAVLVRRQAENAEQAREYYDRLRTEAASPDLRERVDAALCSRDARCALPLDEPIDAVHPCPPETDVKLRLLACDGSQVSPNRHDEIGFGLINAAVIEFEPESGTAPAIHTRTELLPMDDLPSEDDIAVMRDAFEKRFLAERGAEAGFDRRTIALTDGPLELFTDTLVESKAAQTAKRDYLAALKLLADADIPAVGYIDRPRSDLVLRMLKLVSGNPDAEGKPGAADSPVFVKLLAPGERSAVFGMNSRLNKELPEELRLCFFYLNVGTAAKPYICRVEIQNRLTREPEALDLLHGALLRQCRLLGGHPYPYILHRAHECAVVTVKEKDLIKNMLMAELAKSGAAVGEKSNKQIAKDLARPR